MGQTQVMSVCDDFQKQSSAVDVRNDATSRRKQIRAATPHSLCCPLSTPQPTEFTARTPEFLSNCLCLPPPMPSSSRRLSLDLVHPSPAAKLPSRPHPRFTLIIWQTPPPKQKGTAYSQGKFTPLCVIRLRESSLAATLLLVCPNDLARLWIVP